MPWLLSVRVSTAPGLTSLKLGQPVPLSYLAEASNNSAPQPAHWNSPGRFSWFRGLEPGRSVACSRNTRCCSGVSSRKKNTNNQKPNQPPKKERISGIGGDDHIEHVGQPPRIAEGKAGVIDHIVHFPALRRCRQHHRVGPVGRLCLAARRRWRRIAQGHAATGGLVLLLAASDFPGGRPLKEGGKDVSLQHRRHRVLHLGRQARLRGGGRRQLLVEARRQHGLKSQAHRGVWNAEALGVLAAVYRIEGVDGRGRIFGLRQARGGRRQQKTASQEPLHPRVFWLSRISRSSSTSSDGGGAASVAGLGATSVLSWRNSMNRAKATITKLMMAVMKSP